MGQVDSGPEKPADEVDFAEHEKTYRLFIDGAKYGTVLVLALLVAMAAGLVGPFGFLGGLIVFIVLSVAGIYALPLRKNVICLSGFRIENPI